MARHTFSVPERKQVWEKYFGHTWFGKCQLCPNSLDPFNFEVDHVVPLSKGGSDSVSNLQPLCTSCNRSKGIKDNEEMRARLELSPRAHKPITRSEVKSKPGPKRTSKTDEGVTIVTTVTRTVRKVAAKTKPIIEISSDNDSSSDYEEGIAKQTKAQCAFVKTDGLRCKRTITKDSKNYCYQHCD